MDSEEKPKRMRSASASSASVSTISTNMSRSRSPRQARSLSASQSRSPPRRRMSHQDRGVSNISKSSPTQPRAVDEKKRRRNSYSSVDSHMSDGEGHLPHSRERGSSRSTRRKFRHVSPPVRGRRAESRSPQRGRRRVSNDRISIRNDRDGGTKRNGFNNGHRSPVKERSLSPFSKRLALTQSMNMG